MSAVTASDWEALERLAAQVGLPSEKVTTLRRRLEGTRARPGAPYTLLIGRPDAGIEHVVARLLEPAAVETLKASGSRPLVSGPAPEAVRPSLSSWPTLTRQAPWPGHILILRTPGVPPADVMAGLSALGGIDQVILVSRLLQAMHEREREVLLSLAPVAATARVVLVWMPGEEPTDADIAEVTAATDRQIQGRGFRGGRNLGVSILFAGEQANKPGCLTDPSEALHVNEAAVLAGQSGMAEATLSGLIHAIYRKAVESAAATPPGIPPEERNRLASDLTGYLADLGRETGRAAAAHHSADTAWVRRYVLDTIRGWAAYTGVEGHWLRYVETLRPRTQAELFEIAERDIDCLEYRPAARRAMAADSAAEPGGGGGMQSRLVLEAKRATLGLFLGLAAYAAVATMLELPPIVDIAVGLSSMALGGIFGYALGRKLFRGPKSAGGALPQADEPEAGSLTGWTQFERRLGGWFASIAHATATSPAESCRELARRLGIALNEDDQE
jgi:hypothetical protein